MKLRRLALALAVAGASIGISVMTASSASACTGDPCDGFCATYVDLPPAIQQGVFHSDKCPLR